MGKLLRRGRVAGNPSAITRPARLRFWFDADSVIHGRPDSLLAAEILLGGMDEDVAKQELYLLQFTSGCVAQPRASSTLMPHAA